MTPPRNGERVAGLPRRPPFQPARDGSAQFWRALLLALLTFLASDAAVGWPVTRALWRLVRRIVRRKRNPRNPQEPLIDV